MEDIHKLYIQKIAKRLRESLLEIKKIPKDDPALSKAQREIEDALRHVMQILNKEL